ncbi:MAG: hypothetical protein PF961_19245 [Planctomycetota bacterium]|jgi:hypothetical protein|nr:hypothetical protein [Planctomycetota bacterium]
MSDDLRPMSQEEIDAMFAEALGGAAPEPAAEPPPEPAAEPEPEAAQPVAADSDSQDESAEHVAEESDSKTKAPRAGSVEDTDALEGAAGTDTKSGASDSSMSGKVSQNDIDALLAELGAPAPKLPPPTKSFSSSSASSVSGDEADAMIEAVLGELDAGVGELSGKGPATETLTPDELERLVSKHEGDESSDSIGANSGGSSMGGDSGGTGVINQDDIDALVRQMAMATGGPEDAGPAVGGSDVDELLAQAGPQVTVTDAVSPSMIDEVRGQVALAPSSFGGTALMSPEELKGTRYLLVVAVFLLAVCAVTLGFVVSSVNHLTVELAKTNETQVTTSDNFADDLAVAEGWLRDDDPVTVAKGVKFLSEQLKKNYPKKQEVLSERLARHYRSVGAHDKAVIEFAYIADRTSGLVDDPEFYLAYADSLSRTDKREQAREVVYELIANEAWFLEAERPDGSVLGEERVAANRAALKRAMILLGRLYAPGLDDELAALEQVR